MYYVKIWYYLAALEISQVRSEVKFSSEQQSCIFSVASIVLADCYQQLGPDFEFIVASSGGMYIDIPSGTGNVWIWLQRLGP